MNNIKQMVEEVNTIGKKTPVWTGVEEGSYLGEGKLPLGDVLVGANQRLIYSHIMDVLYNIYM